jgi:uncharacterized protein (DUF952 family)
MALIYHITREETWARAREAGEYRQSTLDRTLEEEGFLHAAQGHQVEWVANRFYKQEAALVLLVVDTDLVEAPIQNDAVEGWRDPFPHIYGRLNLDAVIETIPIQPDPGGRFRIVPPQIVFSKGQRILFIGDSITDAGRRMTAVPYGNGYVGMARALLLARYPELDLQIVNRGVGGDTIRNLEGRWPADVIDIEPDWVSIKIGINDVWRQVEGRQADGVPLAEFEETYDRLLELTRERTAARLILVEPYVIEPNRSDRFRALIDGYIDAVHTMADRHCALLARTQAAFDEVLTHQPPSFWAADRVHPDAPGHAVIAREWLRSAGYGDV